MKPTDSQHQLLDQVSHHSKRRLAYLIASVLFIVPAVLGLRFLHIQMQHAVDQSILPGLACLAFCTVLVLVLGIWSLFKAFCKDSQEKLIAELHEHINNEERLAEAGNRDAPPDA